MYNTSKNYKNYIKEPSRMFESKIVLGDRTITNSDVIQLKTELQQPSSGFTIGSCISKTLELTIKNDNGAYARAGSVNVSLGLKMGELIEYIPQGIFNIDTVEKTDYTVKVTAYDNMIKFETPYSEKYENPTLKQVIQQLEEITKVEFDSSINIPNYTLSKIEGYTCREILGYVASLMGGNAYINRDGRCTIAAHSEVDYTITADNYFDYDIEDNIYKIGMLTCQNKLKKEAVDESDGYEAIKEKNTISAGSLGPENMELTFVNPWVTQPILDNIYNMLKDFSFIGYSMKWQGDLSLDVGNIINVTDRNGTARKAFIYYDCINYNGGLTQTIKAKGQTKTSNNFNPENAPTEIERISVKLLLAEKAIIDKANIKDLTAANANIGNLQASVATINTALIHKADIDDLKAANANISNLNAQYANLNNAIINKADIADLNVANANIGKLQASKADISALDATNASIGNLKATVGDIKTLVSGNLTSSNIHSLVLTADKVTVENGFIKNAMVESLVADKITSGTLNTNKLNIASNDGGLVLANNTIQFSDKDKNVRVQIGQDAKGGFNFIVKGTDGKTVLLDSTGLHEGAISDGLIKTDMIADNSINSNKIDYSSVISGLNKDGSNYINASKVAIDLNGQTLDVAFNSVKSSADRANSKIDDLSIGGRNLLLNSSFEKDLANWNGTGTIVNSMLEITGTDSSTRKTQNVSVLPSTQYTFSIELVDQTDTDSFTVFLWEHKSDGSTTGVYRDNNHTFIQTGRVSYTITTQPDCAVLYVLLQANNKKTIHVKNAKLEKGNKATDWTPAPEDTDSAIENIKNITETNTTSIKAIQGQITTLISNTTVTIDGKEKTLKDAYSSTVQTVNSINTTIGEHTSKLNTLNGTVSSNSSKITSIQKDLNGIKTSVSSVQSDLNSTKSQLSSLSTTLDGFESRVETTENNLNNLNIGGRNLLNDSGFELGTINKESVNGGILSIVTEDKYWGTKSMKVVTSSASNASGGCVKCSNLVVGTKYTASLLIKCTTSDSLNYRIMDSSWNTIVNSTNNLVAKTWTKISLTFTATETSCKVGVLNGTPKVITFYIDNIKLEKGNIPTDWTPAPEDTESEITTVKETVTSNSTEISALKNSIALKVDSSTFNSYKENVDGKVNTINSNITSMQSSINLKLDSIQSSVSKMSSTKNLINNSNFNKDLGFVNKMGAENYACRISKRSEYTGWGYVKAPVADENVLYIRYDKAGDNYCEFKDIYGKVKPNTQYTFSYYYSLNGSFSSPSSYLYERKADQMGQIIYTNPIQIGPDRISGQKTWLRYTRTFTTSSDTDSLMVRFGFKSGDGITEILIAGLQLEEGDKVTDWVEGNISSVGTIITQSPNEVMTAFNGISQYFEVSSSGAKFGNLATGNYVKFNDRGLVRYIANQEKNYIYTVQARTFKNTLNDQAPLLTSAQNNVGKTDDWDNFKNSMPSAKDYAQTFTLNFDNELIELLAGFVPQYTVKLGFGISNPGNFNYSGLKYNSQNVLVGEDYLTDSYIEVISMTATSITFKAAKICCVYEKTTDKTGLIPYYQYKRNYAGGSVTWEGLIFA